MNKYSSSKYTSTSEYIKVDKEIWPINSGYSKQGHPLPIYTKQMKGIIKQINIMTENYSRVLVVFFDLHLESFTSDNGMISHFYKLLSYRIKKEYRFKQVGYSWCRELERAKQQHYHMALFLEGRKIRTPHYLYNKIKDAWWDVGGGFMHMSGYHMIERKDWQSKANVIYHLSYHAKERGKGYRPVQTKDYGLSRLKLIKP